MNRGLSLYLDLFRFGMAAIVMLGHGQSTDYSGNLFWQVGRYSQPAVIAFFVLSGFVIANVVETRERDGRIYFASRAARLYSVVLPALILTAVLDATGWRVATAHYENAPLDYCPGSPVL